MKNKLLLLPALLLALAGCKTFEPRPETPTNCAAPGGDAPTPPPVQNIPDTGTVPPVPPSTHIVVGLCTATGAYTAMGVDTNNQRFTFLQTGGRATQQQAFRSFYEAKVPVTVYTQRVKLAARSGSTASKPTPPPPSPSPMAVPQPPQDSGDALYDPCKNIGEEPPPTPKPTGSQWEPNQFTSFQHLSWDTAHGLDAISDPAPSTGTIPSPR